MTIHLTIGGHTFAVPDHQFTLLAFDSEHPHGTRDSLNRLLAKEVPRAYSIEWHDHNLTPEEVETIRDEDAIQFEYFGAWHLMKGRLMSGDDPLVWQGII